MWSRLSTPASRWADPGVALCALVGALLLGFAVSVDFPKTAFGFQSDEATYYSLGHSLADDGDFAFQRRDLVRVWEEFPTGPEGIFLKKGKRVRVHTTASFPFLEWVKEPDLDTTRLYYGKSFLYPLVAAPLVAILGTNGFLVLHAFLLIGALSAAYAFLRARSAPLPAALYALAFFVASAAPVYFVWLTPELFNLSLMMYGLFFWAYKEVAPPPVDPAALGRWRRFLRHPSSDYAAAVLIGLATFSKPLNLTAMLPLALLYATRKQWRRGALVGGSFALTVATLFLLNVAITGELNYQGGDRNTFYGGTGFPFQHEGATFDTTGMSRSTDTVPVEVLFNRTALTTILPHNIVYFVFGRHTGLIPYFFPGVLSAVLFLFARGRRLSFQWCVLAGLLGSSLLLITYMPFTYSGGGGPVGNRYFMGYYAFFLFLTPPLATPWSGVAAAIVGGLFTARLVFNPFYVSFHPAEHAKSGPFRVLPVELSLLNDLPVNVHASRIKQPLGGDPAVLAYFLDDNAYNREGEWFWVRGRSRAELILRALVRPREGGGYQPLKLRRLQLDLRSGAVATTVTIRAGGRTTVVELEPETTRWATVTMEEGLPYRPVPELPTNYVYLLSISSSDGFVPLFTGGRDNRFLGVMVHVTPVYEE